MLSTKLGAVGGTRTPTRPYGLAADFKPAVSANSTTTAKLEERSGVEPLIRRLRRILAFKASGLANAQPLQIYSVFVVHRVRIFARAAAATSGVHTVRSVLDLRLISRSLVTSAVRVSDVVFSPEQRWINVKPILLVLNGKLAGFLNRFTALEALVLVQLH